MEWRLIVSAKLRASARLRIPTENGDVDRLFYRNGKMKELPPPDGTDILATAINDNHQIVGFTWTNDSRRHAFLYDDVREAIEIPH
jgi:probable HAF family extracellular repeat protein